MHPAITRYTTLQDQATDCVLGLPTPQWWIGTEDACDAQRHLALRSQAMSCRSQEVFCYVG
jgi:hypothetical protein